MEHLIEDGEPYEPHTSPPYWVLGLIAAGVIVGLWVAPWITAAFVAGVATALWAGRDRA
jgi:hypothetical protein